MAKTKKNSVSQLEKQLKDVLTVLEHTRSALEFAIDNLSDREKVRFRARFWRCVECRQVNDMELSDCAGDGAIYCFSCLNQIDSMGNVLTGSLFEIDLE